MSAAEPVAGPRYSLLEKAADLLNPILIKEARQSLKSKQFVFTFLLLLIAAWAVSMFGTVLSEGSLEYGSSGRGFFFGFFVVLAVATTLAVPFGAHRSLLAERDLNTYDVLSITTLSPGKIVRGKLASAMLQLFIFYSAITPFMAFASLLNGFDTPTAAFFLVAAMLWSLLLSMVSLMFATLARNRLAQGFLSLVVLGGLGIALWIELWIVSETVDHERIPFDDAGFWYAMGFIAAIGASYFILFQTITVAQITFDADNRTTGVRAAAAAQFWLMAFVLAGYFAIQRGYIPVDPDFFGVLAVICTIHWSVFGLFAVTEIDQLSRRVRRELPRWRILRLLVLPFLPGGARGYLWIILHMAAVWWGIFLLHSLAMAVSSAPILRTTAGSSLSPHFSPSLSSLTPTGTPIDRFLMDVVLQLRVFRDVPSLWPLHLQVTTALCCYLLIYLGIGTALGRWMRLMSTEINAAHIRVVTFLVVMGGTVLPFVPRAFELSDNQSYTLWDVTNPFMSVAEVWSTRSAWNSLILWMLMAAALGAIAVNVPAMFQSARTVLSDEKRAS